MALPRWLGSAFLLACLLLSTRPANAALGGCRGDPKVWLSNGVKVTMFASIDADPSQVTMITYVLHAPRGLRVEGLLYTGGALKDKERVSVVFDRVSGYVVEARADVGTWVVPVTITTTVEKDQLSLSAIGTTTLVFRFP